MPCGGTCCWRLWLRFAGSYEFIGDLQAALSDIREAARLDEASTPIKRQLARVQHMMASQKRKLQKAYSRAFKDGDIGASSGDGGSLSLYPEKAPPPASLLQRLFLFAVRVVKAALWLFCTPLRWVLLPLVSIPWVHALLQLAARFGSRIPVLGWVGRWVLKAGVGNVLSSPSSRGAHKRSR